jgi:hypothetical protein
MNTQFGKRANQIYEDLSHVTIPIIFLKYVLWAKK